MPQAAAAMVTPRWRGGKIWTLSASENAPGEARAERWAGTARRECTDPPTDRRPTAPDVVLDEYVGPLQPASADQSLNQQPPYSRRAAPASSGWEGTSWAGAGRG
jgi:hypothetical protein